LALGLAKKHTVAKANSISGLPDTEMELIDL
jgi:hypothetical protein